MEYTGSGFEFDFPQRYIIKVLLQDVNFFTNWKQLSDALEIPNDKMLQMSNKWSSGTASMYEVVKCMLESWCGRMGKNATVQNFITILQKENLNSTADLLKDHIQQNRANMDPRVQIQPPVPLLTGQVSEAMEDRNLEVLERINGDSCSKVFKIKCLHDNKEFALKRICIGKFVQSTKNPGNVETGCEYFRKLLRQVDNMAQLEHPNIVQYHETWFEGPLRKMFSEMLRFKMTNGPAPPPASVSVSEKNMTYMCIKMELMDTNLTHWLESNPDKIGDFTTTTFITKEMLDALAFIHSNNIVHRDLKPNNILMNVQQEKLVVKIGEFGLSRQMNEKDGPLTIQVGGKSFSSPEMERGDRYDFKTDIFSLGLICLVMLHKFENTIKMEKAFDHAREGDLKTVTLIETSHGSTFTLLRRMLDSRSVNRPTAVDALKVLQAS